MTQELTVKAAAQYGRIVIKPICEKSVILAKIAGTQTLTENTINLAKQLGYTFKVIQETVTL